MRAQKVTLHYHNYRYFPYERDFAIKEVKVTLNPKHIEFADNHIDIWGKFSECALRKLVYFSGYEMKKNKCNTLQCDLERQNGVSNLPKRQSTRYSVHGLHEYKGKFNPQVVRSILNFLKIKAGDKVFDPFCGSGTTLVECAHVGISSVGCDINPFASFLSNAKLKALSVPAKEIVEMGERIFGLTEASPYCGSKTERREYLKKWFTPEILASIERYLVHTMNLAQSRNGIYLAMASNLLRDYSLQEPKDLRIRRRKSPLPDTPWIAALKAFFEVCALKIEAAQRELGVVSSQNRAYQADARTLSLQPKHWTIKPPYQAAITSPPYATALPYIDTQRLSLVWLSLCHPSEIRAYESLLTGSREFRSAARRVWKQKMSDNAEHLPDALRDLCLELQRSLSDADGFRRRVVPSLLYRYFADMQRIFRSTYPLMESGARFALIVGHNHTTLGGKRFDIDTPKHLIALALHVGWELHDIASLQTYQRYDLHRKNSVAAETLIVLKKP